MKAFLWIVGAVLLCLGWLGCGDGHDHAHDDGHDHKDHGHKDHGHKDHGHDHSGPNPHIWLDPVRAKAIVAHAAAELAPLVTDERKLRIVVSIFPLEGLIAPVLGERGEVTTLLPPGVSPHGFEAGPRDMKRLSEADAVLYIGRGVDNWVKAAAGSAGGAKLIELSALIKRGGVDQATLGALRDGAAATSGKLDDLHARYEAALAKVKTKQLVTFHNAFDLLAERYGLKVVAHLTEVELSGGGEVAPAQLREAQKAVKEYELKVLYAEPQFPDKAMHAIREATGVAVLRLDPLGNPNQGGYRDYFEMMESNLKTLVDGQTR